MNCNLKGQGEHVMQQSVEMDFMSACSKHFVTTKIIISEQEHYRILWKVHQTENKLRNLRQRWFVCL